MKKDDLIFLEALDKLLEKHADNLADKLIEKLGSISIAPSNSPGRIESTSQKEKTLSTFGTIEMDESTFVVEQKTDDIQKGFDEITETKTTKDEEAAKSVSKLRGLKKK